MTAGIERELGRLTEAVQNQTKAIDKLTDKFDEHVEADNERFAEVAVAQAVQAGHKAASATWRAVILGLLGVGGGMLGGHMPHWLGGPH